MSDEPTIRPNPAGLVEADRMLREQRELKRRMVLHEHAWEHRPDQSSPNHQRYLCACGTWGWRSTKVRGQPRNIRRAVKPITPYVAGGFTPTTSPDVRPQGEPEEPWEPY